MTKKTKKLELKLTKEQLYFINKALHRYKIKFRKKFLENKSYVGNYIQVVLDKNLTKKEWKELAEKWRDAWIDWEKDHHNPKKKENKAKYKRGEVRSWTAD